MSRSVSRCRSFIWFWWISVAITDPEEHDLAREDVERIEVPDVRLRAKVSNSGRSRLRILNGDLLGGDCEVLSSSSNAGDFAVL